MPVRSCSGPARARLGIVLLNLPHYQASFAAACDPADERGIGSLPPGFLESPVTWPVPTAFAVAEGARPAETLGARPAAARGLLTALRRLEEHCDLAIADCGFFWAARPAPCRRAAVLLSGLDLLPLSTRMTRRSIGVLTFSAPALKPLLAGHPERGRLRIVGFNDLPQWAAFDCDDYGTNGRWSLPALRDELLGRVARELHGGDLQGVGALLIECTLMPQFRAAIREVTDLPVLDVTGSALAMPGDTTTQRIDI